jgi:hypothetical protein
MTNIPVDKENYPPVIEKALAEIIRLSSIGGVFLLKTISFDKVFEGIEFNPTSATF